MAKRINTAVWMEDYKRWQINVQKDGKRKSFYSSTPGRKGQIECNDKADEWMNGGTESGSVRVSVLYDKWIEELKIATSKSHWRNYEHYGRNYIKSSIGHKKLSIINEQILQDVILLAYTQPKNQKSLSEKTLKNIRACLISFIKYARKNQATKLFPENLYIPKDAAPSNKKTLQPEDIKILFSRTHTVGRDKLTEELFIHAFRFQVVTGMRPGEIIGLRKTDISDNICTIRRAINAYKEQTTGKNKNALRSFILPQLALSILNDQKELMLRLGIISPYIFPGENAEAIVQATYYKHWTRYRKCHNLTVCSPYELRHTFFSANKGNPLEYIKLIGGHSQDFDTFGIYGHEMDGDAKVAAKLVNATFSKILNKGKKPKAIERISK